MSKEDIYIYQHIITSLSKVINEIPDDIVKEYIIHTMNIVDGTLDPLLMHDMSIKNMDKGKRMVKFLREMGKHIIDMKKLISDETDVSKD
jgi:hypothetical protein